MTGPTLYIERPHITAEERAARRKRKRAEAWAEAAGAGWKVWLVKIVCLGIIDAMGIYAILVLIGSGFLVPLLIAAAILLINVIYLKPGLLPAKYLTPGLVFLFVFQIFVVLFCIYIAFTNYGSGHVSTKDDAVNALLIQNQQRVDDSPTYPLSIVEQNGSYFFLVTDPDGDALVGGADRPLEPADDAQFSGDRAISLPGYTTLNFAQIVANQSAITALAVPFSDDPNDGTLQTRDGSVAYQYTSTLAWDATAGTMTNTETGVVYKDNGNGSFVSDDGQTLATGWQVWVGLDNFVRAFTTESIRGPFIAVTIWTFAFAILSVATTFALGLFLAIVFNDPRMKSKKYYRVVMILPYAFPAFLSALVWAGMFNQDFGFINQTLLGGASIPWLQDPFLAKVSILIVNLWLGYPYMFLVTTGAIQSIPEDIQEAGKVDGAGVWQIFRYIKFPLLLVAVAPLLISSFAFNFNNFNLIYMLTGGGPRIPDASINVGHSDILISMVYKVAFVGAERDYGLASAFSIIIFVLVAVISYLSFRQTKVLEELN
ncbi:ABC transporter permease subunit [Microbacterium dextranolyticum]|uniref:Maltose/maltodextrin transport system permease protein n=1 Tax=Microbacterium dextranolyticum TaxID=36806 RepID=A0A9W6HLN9_9MICO|nr:ABC transporter permease subunit [Microbacterium dextranolyticum]MBM7463431.1 arabinogalactan oligomer/maltooligosaccharide transport system permease protein [Microbacterium dextranolyticum]GLJ95467.1 sugar ABC transporter permease [Microbacterium dextranolyticum]